MLVTLALLVLLSNTPAKDSKKTKKTNITTPPYSEKVLGRKFVKTVVQERVI